MDFQALTMNIETFYTSKPLIVKINWEKEIFSLLIFLMVVYYIYTI